MRAARFREFDDEYNNGAPSDQHNKQSARLSKFNFLTQVLHGNESPSPQREMAERSDPAVNQHPTTDYNNIDDSQFQYGANNIDYSQFYGNIALASTPPPPPSTSPLPASSPRPPHFSVISSTSTQEPFAPVLSTMYGSNTTFDSSGPLRNDKTSSYVPQFASDHSNAVPSDFVTRGNADYNPFRADSSQDGSQKKNYGYF
jgi:hypothetical protein